MSFEYVAETTGTKIYQDEATGAVRLIDHEGTDAEVSLDLSADVVRCIGGVAWRAKAHSTVGSMSNGQMRCEIIPKGMVLNSGRHDKGFPKT